MFDTSDTIAAIATARGGALRGIVRVSGPAAGSCLEKVFDRGDSLPVNGQSWPIASWKEVPFSGANSGFARRATIQSGTILTPPPLGAIPCDIYFWPTTRSYTRQPSFEVHTFGSPPVLDAILSAVCQTGCRLAQPGEFTMRAFLAGRLDLTQAEAVLGVIDARDAAELTVALQQLAGGLARPLHALRDRLLDLLARLEAGLDFVEEDIEFVQAAEVRQELEQAQQLITSLFEQVSSRSQVLADIRIVLRGWPNVGKSSLFNALTGTPAAIVSEQAGTTRDFVTRIIQFDGLPIEIIDTAGIELSSEGITRVAQDVTSEQSRTASLQLLCLDASRPVNEWEVEQLAQPDPLRLVVLTKCDLPPGCNYSGEVIRTSSREPNGLQDLWQAVRLQLERTRPTGFCIDSTAARCEQSLRLAAESIERALATVLHQGGDELIAAELRLALHELGLVAGTVYTDDILDRIFSRFCIGK